MGKYIALSTVNDTLPEVSFVMPCLDEAETLADCIVVAQRCIQEQGLAGEIVVADNGSTDGSQEIAERYGARVVHVAEKGYGAALMGGFEAARGRFLVMGDADMSYDFGEAMPMIDRLRGGADLVMGSRFLGTIEPGAMPWSHYWIGNPILSLVGRILFHSPVSDFHCGFRALTKSTYERLGLRTTGMEFATELVVKAAAMRLRVDEVPVTLRPDGRSRPPHLRTWRDGWRHLRFMMSLSPRFTLFLPGLLMMVVGGVLLARLSISPLDLGVAVLDIHTMQLASLLMIVGYQGVTIAVAARIYATSQALGPPGDWIQRMFERFTLERGLILGALLLLAGLGLIGQATWHWAQKDFGQLMPTITMRPVLLGATFVALSIQTLLMSFLYSMFGVPRRGSGPTL